MFFKNLNSYKKFNLTPRYWDPKKEEKEARERRIRAEQGLENSDEDYESRVREQLRGEFTRRRGNRSVYSSRRNLRLFMILIMLFLAAFYVFIKNPDGLLKLFGL